MKQGFTLMEMMVVFVILGILSMVGVYSYQTALRKGEIDAFISELQTQFTPLVYSQGSIAGNGYATMSDFTSNSIINFPPSSDATSGGVKGLYFSVNSGTMNNSTNARSGNIASIKIYNKSGMYTTDEYLNFGYAPLSDKMVKTINIPSGVIFDSACMVTDSHATCSDVTASSSYVEYSLAYHGINVSPYAFIGSGIGSSYQSNKGLRLNFRSQLEPLWYTITFSPYGGMTIGRGCKLQVCL